MATCSPAQRVPSMNRTTSSIATANARAVRRGREIGAIAVLKQRIQLEARVLQQIAWLMNVSHSTLAGNGPARTLSASSIACASESDNENRHVSERRVEALANSASFNKVLRCIGPPQFILISNSSFARLYVSGWLARGFAIRTALAKTLRSHALPFKKARKFGLV